MNTTRIRKIVTFRLDDDLIKALKVVHERDGIQASEQARRALRAWLEAKGALVKSASGQRPARSEERHGRRSATVSVVERRAGDREP